MRVINFEIAGVYGTTRIDNTAKSIAVSGFMALANADGVYPTIVSAKCKLIENIGKTVDTEYTRTDLANITMHANETIMAGYINGKESYFSEVVLSSGHICEGYNIKHPINDLDL